MAKNIVLLGTLDTKGEEIKYVKEWIEGRGHKTIVIDGGIMGNPLFQPDISNEEVAEAGGLSLKEVMALNDEGKAIEIMGKGASKISLKLYSSGGLDGIMGMGGSMGAGLCFPAMRNLPLGVAKLMVSTMTFTPFITPELAGMDQVMIQPISDLWGLNVITRHTLEVAAAAIVGMTEVSKKIVPEKPLIGLTVRGAKYSIWIKPLLEEKGYELAVFHAQGVGGKIFESLIRQGLIKAALDLSPCEIVDDMLGTPGSAGSDRMEAAGDMGIPQIVSCGCLDLWMWKGAPETLPVQFKSRKMHAHNSLVMAVKTSREEMEAAGEIIARKLNRAKGPVGVLIPSQGISQFDAPGEIFYDPEGRKAFTEAFKRNVMPGIEVVELDAHINDPLFAQEAVAFLLRLMKENRGIH